MNELWIWSGKSLWIEIIEKYVLLEVAATTMTSRSRDQHILIACRQLELLLDRGLDIVERNSAILFLLRHIWLVAPSHIIFWNINIHGEIHGKPASCCCWG